jgi:hypothetical protein
MNNHKPVLNQGQALKSNILTWREFIPPVSPHLGAFGLFTVNHALSRIACL